MKTSSLSHVDVMMAGDDDDANISPAHNSE